MKIRPGAAITLACGILWAAASAQAQEARKPVIVNGDTVEYSADNKEVSAVGNVEVDYEGTRLTCDKLTVNTASKDARAEGNVRLQDPSGVIRGREIVYNFQTKTGVILDANFRSNPYFGATTRMEKLSDNEFTALRTRMTTCSFDQPHYYIRTRKMRIVAGEKIQTQDDVFYLGGGVPLVQVPRYSHSLRDPLMHVQVMPGSRKEWGAYLLTASRYQLTDNVKGRLYLDYRSKLGFAEGFGANYTSPVGRGDLKVYYTNEEPDNLAQTTTASEFERGLVRLRHKWEIDRQTSLTAEYYKIKDDRRKKEDSARNFLKDYYYREYEQDSQPLSYASFYHSFANSSINVLFQKRTNHWFNQVEKLPEASYSMPSLKIGESPLYFQNATSLASFDKKDTSVDPATDITVSRFDTANRFSLPSRVSIINFTPFVENRTTVYDTGADGESSPTRTIFYTGADLSTKFYRIYDMRSNFLGLDVNALRHIITPTISYNYNHDPSTDKTHLRQVDSVDALDHNHYLLFELSNKLQTKRKGAAVELANLRVNTTYNLDAKASEDRSNGFVDFLFDLELLPYSWMRLDTDSILNRKRGSFTQVNSDLNFYLGDERTIGIGQRYLRKGGKSATFSAGWRLTPKWKFGAYERYQFNHTATVGKGLREQQYTFSRDLHCWLMDFTYSIQKEHGHTIWLIFRLKAFPDIEFGIDQSYREPKSGAQPG